MTDVNGLITRHLDIWSAATEKKSNVGRGNKTQASLYGVKKLRSFILELAVRGKLVPQDEMDGKALDLLNEIAEIRNELMKKNIVKTDKSPGPVLPREMSFEVPKNWAWTRLIEIGEIAPKNEADNNDVVSFVPMREIGVSHTGAHGHENRRWGEINKGYTQFADGDIAIAKITPCFENGKAAIFSNLLNGIGAGSTELHVARLFSEKVVPKFVLLHLKSPTYLANGKAVMTGSAGQKRVPSWYFSDIPIALPPTSEQHRIVAKVDELMALCDELEQNTADSIQTHQTIVETLMRSLTNSQNPEEFAECWALIEDNFDVLFTTEESIEQLKRNILQLAVRGKLEPQDSNDEPSVELLNKIKSEKNKLIERGEIKKQMKLPNIDKDELPYAISPSWSWVRLNEISSYIQRGKGPKYADTGELKVVSQKCIQWEGFDTALARYVDDTTIKKYQPERYIKSQDLLWNSTGTGTVGRINVIEHTEDNLVADSHLTIIRPLLVSSAYLWCYLASPGIQSRFSPEHPESLVSGTTKQVELNTSEVKLLPVPIPPLREQQRIVAKVDELISLCDELKIRISALQEHQIQLANSFTSKAVA